MGADLQAAVLARAESLRQELLDKVEANLSGGVLASQSGALKASIVSSLLIDDAHVSIDVASVGVPYAGILEHGGVTSPHDIVPLKARALMFAGAAGPTFARRVHHPGSHLAGRAYLAGALADLQPEIVGGLKASVLVALNASVFAGDGS